MTATKSLNSLDPDFRAEFLQKDDRLIIDGDGLKSPFFEIRPGVIVGPNPAKSYDRPRIREKRSALVVTWGRDKNGQLRLGMIRQKRPPADDPKQPGDNHPPVVFAQIVMGYFSDGDSLKEAALRERLEEAGKAKVLGFVELPFPLVNLEPNTFATWHSLAFVEVDLSTVDEGHTSEHELITSTMYRPAAEIFKHIVDGTDETGAYYRGSGTTLGPLMVFFSWIFYTHPDLFPRP